jgi:hydrogenase maturation factor
VGEPTVFELFAVLVHIGNGLEILNESVAASTFA